MDNGWYYQDFRSVVVIADVGTLLRCSIWESSGVLRWNKLFVIVKMSTWNALFLWHEAAHTFPWNHRIIYLTADNYPLQHSRLTDLLNPVRFDVANIPRLTGLDKPRLPIRRSEPRKSWGSKPKQVRWAASHASRQQTVPAREPSLCKG